MPEAKFFTDIGALTITEVFIRYDGPRVFSCLSSAGQSYLCLFADETDDSDRWLLVPVSNSRMSAIRTGAISLRNAALTSEDGYVWLVTTGPQYATAGTERVPCDNIPTEYLPSENMALSSRSEAAQAPTVSIVAEARASWRDTIDVFVDAPSTGLHQISAKLLANVVNGFQELVFALDPRYSSGRGPVPSPVVQANTLNVLGTMAGSFGIRFQAGSQADVLGLSDVEDCISHALDLLEAGSDSARLQELIHQLRPHSARKYQALLRLLDADHASLRVEMGSPVANRREVRLGRIGIETALGVLSKEEQINREVFEKRGSLTALYFRRRKFEFVDDTGQRYYGVYLEGSLPPSLSLVELIEARSGVARICEVVEARATGEEHSEYTLMEFRLAESEQTDPTET